ncbi:hypothetical protein MRB53_041684 [Persea americana]|nr:hypothetical protein MRB53_041684 [Persea americana]
MSLKSVADMRSITSMLATAVRIGQRLGIHMESTYTKCTPLQAEMRRRLWWTLVTFDHRMCEMCDYRSSSLMPIWDCKIPLNATDYVLRAEMKTAPAAEEKPTEACFAVTRARINDVLRHNTLHLNFLNPVLKQLARSQDDNSIDKLAKDMAEKFATWDMADPLQFMTATTAEALIARCRLLEHYSSHQASLTRPTDKQRSTALSQALRMLECDTILRNAQPIRHFVWFTDLYFPALAYHHILNGLTRKSSMPEAANAWRIMDEHYKAVNNRPALTTEGEFPGVLRFYTTSGPVILLAWRTYVSQHGEIEAATIIPPQVVHDIMKTTIDQASTEGPAWMTWENKGSDLTQAQLTALPIVEPQRKSVPPEDVFGQAIMDVDSDAFWENLGLT